jgi:hypothetical protein
MLNLWKIKIAQNQAGDTSGGGGTSGGTTSVLTTSQGGGTSTSTDGGAGNSSGTNTSTGTSTNTNAGNPPGGNTTQDWRSQLPPELQSDASLQKFGSIHALAGAYVSAQKLIGQKGIPVPGEATTEEQWRDIFEKLGVPKEVKDYNVKFKDQVKLDPKFTEDFKSMGHKLGLLPKQAQALADWFSDVNINSSTQTQQQYEAQAKQNVEALKQEWGQAFQLKAARINKVIGEFGGNEVAQQLHEMGLGSDPKFLKMMAGVADKLYKEGKIVGDEGGGNPQLTPAEAKAEAMKIIGDANHAYHKKDHPGHKDAVKKVQEYFEMSVPKV